MEQHPEVTGVLLAGGRSQRMGTDKARLWVRDKSLFEHPLAMLQRFFPRVLVAGDRPDLARPGVPVVADRYPGSALGGIHTGLRAATTDWVFVAPCDMPYPNAELVRRLLARRAGVDAVVPRTPQGYEPVFAAYHKRCLSPMESMLRQDQYRIYDFYQRVAIRFLEPPDLPLGWERALLNLNTPDQVSRLQEEGP